MRKEWTKGVWTMLISVLLVFGLWGADAYSAEKARYGGTLTYTDMYPQINPMSWDVIDWNWRLPYDGGYYMEHLLMGDLQKGPRGTKEYDFSTTSYIPPGVEQGELAERWEVKKNPLRIIFHLRKGVMWQEKPGIMKVREFVADDVLYSINRAKTSRKALPGFWDFIDRLEAKDKYTVVMYLKEWKAAWPYHVGWGFYDSIQAPEQEKAPGGPGKWENACGTGPFMLEEYKSGFAVTYKKNPNYWGSTTIDGQEYKLPFVDKAVSMLIRDESSRLSALRTGKLDFMVQIGDREMRELRKTTPELIFSKRLRSAYFAITLRMDKKPFNDIRVRRALNMAIDRKVLADNFSGGELVLVHFPFPSTYKGSYTPFEKLPPKAKELFVYNPEKAKKLLAEAGYPNGFSFTCTYGGSAPDVIDYLSMIVAMMEKIGVKMEINVMPYSASLSKQMKFEHTEAVYKNTDQGTPMSMIRKTFSTGNPWNLSMMSDPYVDKMVHKLESDPSITEAQRHAALKELSLYIMEQAPVIMLPGQYVYSVWWPWVKNYYGEVRAGAHRFAPIVARIWVDQELKKKMGY